MKKNMLVGLLIFILAFGTVLAGCSSNTDNSGNSGENNVSNTPANNTTPSNDTNEDVVVDEVKLFEEPLDFSFYVNYDWYGPKGFGDDKITAYLRDELKVNVEEISSNGQAKQKLGTIIASDDYPDVIQMNRGTDFNQLVDNGKIVPVNLDVMPNLKKLAKPETLAMLTHTDGKLYGIPNWFNNFEEMDTVGTNRGWIINQKIHKELGEPSLETLDDLYAYLKLVKANYPDVVPLESAYTSNGNIQVQNFIYGGYGDGRSVLYTKIEGYFAVPNEETKQLTSIFDDPAFKGSLEWVNTFFQEKLLSQDTFTQKLEQFTEKLNNGKVAVAGVYEANKWGKEANDALGEEVYMYIKPPVNAGVDRSTLKISDKSNLGWNFNAVTVDAEEPDRIFAYIDWMIGYEGTRVYAYGPEGDLWEGFDPDTQVPNLKPKYHELTQEEKDEYKFRNWNMQGSWANSVISDNLAALDPESMTFDGKAQRFYAKNGGYIITDQFSGLDAFEAGSNLELARQNIVKIMSEATAKLTFAKTKADFDSVYEKAKTEVLNAGYEDILEFNTNVWQSNLEKIGN